MRLQYCSRIASYFVKQIKRNEKINRLYVEEYPRRITESLKAHRILDILIELMEALCFLKEFEILHRDLKPANVLLSMAYSVKLIDFGSSHFSSNIRMMENMPHLNP